MTDDEAAVIARQQRAADEEANVLARARRAADGLRASSRVVDLLSGMLPETDEGHALVELRDRAAAAFNGLVMLEGTALRDELRRLESEVNTLETAVETLDRELPMSWFREHFDATLSSSVALADYATLLGRHVGDSPLRLDRIQFILTRVVSFFMRAEDASPTRRRELLAEALPAVTVDETTRRTAVAFLRDAARRVAGFDRLKALIDAGFFIDVRGYKLSLRDQLLDPDVMAAAIELNEAINDNLRRLAEADRGEGKELEAHLAEVDQRIKSMFGQLRQDESATQARFDQWLAHNASKRGAAPAFKPLKAQATSKHRRKYVLAAVLLGLLVVTWLRSPEEGKLAELAQADVTSLDSLLVSGTVAPPERPRVFIGQVDKTRWALAPIEERRRAANAIALAVSRRGWLAATVMMEQQVVVQIENGRILLVQ